MRLFAALIDCAYPLKGLANAEKCVFIAEGDAHIKDALI